jgi:hypothetical protein
VIPGPGPKRGLVPAHRVREWHLEEAVVSADQLDHALRERRPLFFVELGQARHRAAGNDEGLEGPRGPERDNDQPLVIGDQLARTATFLGGVVQKKPAAGRFEVPSLPAVFLDGLDRKRVACPDLAVRVAVRGAHRRAAVLEDLHPLVGLAEFGGLGGPQVHDAPEVLRTHLRNADVVARREADHAAGAAFRFRPQEADLVGLQRGVRTERREIVREDVRVLVGRVTLAVRPRVAGAEVAARVVRRQVPHGRSLLATEPGPSSPLRGHQEPLVAKWVVAPVRLREERSFLGFAVQVVGHSRPPGLWSATE